MASQPIGERTLQPAHNVARYCGPRRIANGVPLYDAFLLRDGESFLSANWLEYFHPSDRQFQMSGVRNTLANKGFRINSNGGFAVLNVGITTQQIRRARLRFALLGQTSDPSHAGIFGYRYGDTDTAKALVRLVREMHPAAE